jgi:hypothetical protein
MKTSAYSKMYLVLPSIYDKVLKSIDEKDKKTLEQLNIDKENSPSRPSEKYLEDVANTELQENNPQTEFIDPETTILNEPEQTFGESEAEITEPTEMIEPIHETLTTTTNPLKTDCGQPDVQDKFIPMIQPGLKRKRIAKPKIIVPSILKQNPQIQQIKESAVIQPNINRPPMSVKFPTKVSPIKEVPRNFVCNFCKKTFKSTYHLNRHIGGVHKNLVQLSDPTLPQNITPPSELVSTQPVIPQPGPSNFQNWQTQLTSQPQSRKRSSAEAKLKYTPRPLKMRPNDEEYDEW